MALTSTIKGIEPMGTWSNGQRTFNKFRVSFANGDILSFLAVKDFQPKVGESINYEKNESLGTGKWIRDKFENNQNFTPQQNFQKPKSKDDVQDKIIRQSMLKAAVDFHHNNNSRTEEAILHTAQVFINFINQ